MTRPICPTGKVVVGGGSQVVGEGTADFKTFLQETAPGTIGGGAQSLWLTALRNSDTKPHKVGLFAVCATKPVGYQVVRKDTAVPAGGFVRTTANCPVGKVVLAGGAQVVGEGSAEFRTRVQESAPGTIGGGAQSVWLAAVRNYSVNPHTIGVFAVCASKPAGYQVVRKDTSVAAGGFLRTTANCPAGPGRQRRRRERDRRGHRQLRHQPAGVGARHHRLARPCRCTWPPCATAPWRARSASTPSARAPRPATRSSARTSWSADPNGGSRAGSGFDLESAPRGAP